MMKKILLLLVISIAACGMASAEPLLVTASGQFSSVDFPGALVTPNGVFSLSFAVGSNPTPLAGTVTSLSFDVPVTDFAYELNNTPVAVTPSEITFYTLADGGLFNITFGSGLSAAELGFQGDQAFSGTTAAPTFAFGDYAVSSWTYSDPVNFDSGSGTVSISPEPSTVLLISGGLLALVRRKFRKQ